MPSPKDPNSTVQPGPGRLPSNTVPAGALLVNNPAGGGASLEAHLVDPVDAHAATAISLDPGPNWADGDTNITDEVQARLDEIISELAANDGSDHTGQPGYTGEIKSAPAGPLSPALQALWESVNAKAVWVLDSNPAATEVDFAGATALIDAVTAYNASNSKPILYLREGTYNWNDPGPNDLDNVTILGANQATTTIQNAGGDLRAGQRSVIRGVTIDVSGDLLLPNPEALIERCTLTVGGNVNITGADCAFRHIAPTAPIYMIVDADRTVVDGADNIQLSMTASTDDCSFRNISITSLNDTSLIAWDTAGEGHIFENITFDGITEVSPYLIRFSASYSKVTNLRVLNSTQDPFTNWQPMWSNGSNNEFRHIIFDVMDGFDTALPIWQFEGQDNKLYDLLIDDVVNGYSGAMFDVDGDRHTIERVHVIEIDDLSSGGTNLITISGSNHTVRNVLIEGIEENTGNAVALFNLFAANTILEDVEFRSLGVTTDLRGLADRGILLRVQNWNGRIHGVIADGVSSTIRCGHFMSINSDIVTSSISGCVAILPDVQGDVNALRAVSGDGEASSISDCYFIAVGGSFGDPQNDYVVHTDGVTGLKMSNCIIAAYNGRAGGFADSAVVLEDCYFQDIGGNPWDGTQLFYGWSGTELLPLTVRNCTMIYGASNTDPLGGSGDSPVIFFGGRASTAATDHGPTVVDGLQVIATSSLVSQHRDSVVAFDFQEKGNLNSRVNNLTIDLAQVPWWGKGAGRGTFGSDDGCVLELNGYNTADAGAVKVPVENVSILNMQNYHNNYAIFDNDSSPDERHAVLARGCAIRGLIVDGAADLVEERATGHINAIAGANLNDGETFTLDDGTNTPTVFEFDLNGAGVTPGNVQIVYTAGDTDEDVRDAIISAIESVNETLWIGAFIDYVVPNRVRLANRQPGTVGNQSISDTVADGGFTTFGLQAGGGEPIAVGLIGCGDGSAFVDGDIFTLRDGRHVEQNFEFDSGGGVTAGNVAVPFTGGDSEATIATNIAAAINGVGAQLDITATVVGSHLPVSPGYAAVVVSNSFVGHYGNQVVSAPVLGGVASMFSAPLTTGAFVSEGLITLEGCHLYGLDLFPTTGVQVQQIGSSSSQVLSSFVSAVFSNLTDCYMRNFPVGSTCDIGLKLAFSQGDKIAMISAGGRATSTDDASPNSVQPFCHEATGGNTFAQAIRLEGSSILKNSTWISTSPSWGSGGFSSEIGSVFGYNTIDGNSVQLSCPRPGDQDLAAVTLGNPSGPAIKAISSIFATHDRIVNNNCINTVSPLPGQSGSATASGEAVNDTRINVFGASGFDASFDYTQLGRYLTLSGSGIAGYNGTWPIIERVSATSVDCYNEPADLAINQSVDWVEVEYACCAGIHIIDSDYCHIATNTVQYEQLVTGTHGFQPAIFVQGFLGVFFAVGNHVTGNIVRNQFGGFQLNPIGTLGGGGASISVETAGQGSVTGNVVHSNAGGGVYNAAIIFGVGGNFNVAIGNTLMNLSGPLIPGGTGFGPSISNSGASNLYVTDTDADPLNGLF
jgi:hypothetical protein